MKIKAYSKINLGLRVYHRLENEKMHRIDSLFLLNKRIYDQIEVRKSSTLSIIYFNLLKKVTFPNCIIAKSLRYLQKKYKIRINYEIIVHKNIPVMSGMGGGSSDAAVVIKYFCKINNIINLDLLEISEILGSDIPFFLSGYRAARVRNYGDSVTKIKLPKIKYKTFNFNFPTSTKKIYDSFDEKHREPLADIDEVVNKLKSNKLNDNIIINDLQQVVFELNPKLKKISDMLKNHYNFVTLSGSGDTLVVIRERK